CNRQWSMHGRIAVHVFCFDECFHPYDKDDFATAFFQDPNVLENLKILPPSSCQWTTLGTDICSYYPNCTINMTFMNNNSLIWV
uniref:Cilia- and flagella-associated protein 300 n=1 Tax=Callorhinchus milii TaxID=7868 RepID=A0A4W3H7G6_CALMI